MSDVVAANIRAYRVVRHLSQEDLASWMRKLEHATWTSSTVSEVERGNRNVTIDELLALAFMLNAELVDLLDATGLDRRTTTPIDLGPGGTIGAAGVSHWLRGIVRIVTEGPNRWDLDEVEGHRAEYEEARRSFDPIRARSTEAAGLPERQDVDTTKTRADRRREWNKEQR
jgi:transcriptional regulator with XRE-family HTH domain